MKKRIFAIVMAVIMIASLVAGAVPALAADEGITITVHYHREDGNYEDWQLWAWDPDAISTLEPPYEFTEVDGDMVTTFTVKTGTTKIGYIARLGEWTEKDIDWDQFINITGILSGHVDFYIESGVATQPDANSTPSMQDLVDAGKLVLGDDVVQGVVITNNQYKTANRDGLPEITLQMSSKLDYTPDVSTFGVENADGPIEVTSVRSAGQYVYLTLGSELDLARAYNVVFEGRKYAVSMPDFYSSNEFESEFTYTGDDLGATYTKEKTTLRVWAPTAVDVVVNLYSNGDPSAQATPDSQEYMTKDVSGTWVAELQGDMNGKYYTYQVTTDTNVKEACDPYARTTGVNGERAMIIDLDSTDPEGWATDKDPNYDLNFTDHVIYELHVRDLSTDSSSGISNVGKFLGLIETGTTNSNGIPTGLDHMKDLGITAVHLLPIYDFSSVDETKLDNPDANKFNWGYDPKNYNVPEGSYSTDPYNGAVRVSEMKQMVKGLHDAGISVIMDVVYNHVADSANFCFNKIVPGYFSRPDSNGSGCGNDTASERVMVRKYIVDSVTYWADEYHIDGFRFDLVGLLDTDTINAIIESVHETHPNVKFYGEGWTMGTNTTKSVTLCTQTNSTKVPEFAFFSDTVRNLIKGGTYGGVNAGYISGGSASTAELNACFKGMPSWCTTPSQSINYISCHDNNTLFDHITMVTSGSSVAERISMNKLGAAFYMTAQGIPFFQAGEELLRSKPTEDGGYNENSYNAGDAVNSIKWDDLNKAEYMDTYEYYKGLIAFRKAHPALRLTTAAEVDANVSVISNTPANVSAYQINGGVNGETAESIFVIFNANKSSASVSLPEGNWTICVNGEDAGTASLGTASGSVNVAAISAMVLVKGEVTSSGNETTGATQATNNAGTNQGSNQGSDNNGSNAGLIIALGVVAVVAIIAVAFVIIKKKG